LIDMPAESCTPQASGQTEGLDEEYDGSGKTSTCNNLSHTRVVHGEAGRVDNLLFGETQSAIIVTCTPARLTLVEQAAREHDIPCLVLGSVGGDSLVIGHSGGRIVINLPVEEMESLWQESIPSLMG
jgi:phosphoribosylformylglycinamidine synthase